MRYKGVFWSGVGIVVLAAAAVIYLTSSMRPKTTPIVFHKPVNTTTQNPVDNGTGLSGKQAPNFTLTDQYGQKFSLSQFRGKVVLLAFVDSECTNICPLTTQSMVNAVQMLGPKAAAHIQMIGVNANPLVTSVAAVKHYSAVHGLLNKWRFGTASKQQLEQVWAHYDISDQILNGAIDHTPALYIIDAKGQERQLFLTPQQYGAVQSQASVIAKKIALYLPAGVKPKKLQPVAYNPPDFSPKTTVQMPKVTANGVTGTTSIGPGKPELDVFFASWAQGITTDLKQLGTYAAQPGNPSVVGVDVEPVEPSLQAVESTLKAAGPLPFPIGLDRTGDIADAYNVTDIVWLTLTDGKGHIIWQHDGWLPVKTLQADVAQAMKQHSVASP